MERARDEAPESRGAAALQEGLPPWSRVEGKYVVNFQGMLSDSGSIVRGVHFWEEPFALISSPG